MNTNRDIKRFWTTENPTDKRQTRGLILNTDEILFNVGDLEDRVSDIETFLNTVFDSGILKEAFGGTENSQWAEFLKDLSEQLDNAVLTQNDDDSYLFVGNESNSGKFNFSSLWNWIVSKLSSVFGLVKNNETGKVTLTADITGDVVGNVTGDVTGNAATATLANRAEKVDISTSSSNANFLLASIDDDAIVNGETPKRTSLKFNEVSKELSSGDKVFASLEDVNSITAKYITSSAAGAAFADEAALQGTLYYAGQVISTQTTPALGDNDYCIVLDSGFAHDHSTARYVYQNGVWTFQYKVSQITLTQSQLDALNSGITSSDVTKLNGIETGAQVNVQSDWNETDPTSDKYIENKPAIQSVGDGVLSFYFNGEPTPTVTFSANQETNARVDIETICYGECNTAGSTATKTVTPPPVSYFQAGAKVSIKFANANTAAAPTLDITAEDTPISIALSNGTLPDSTIAQRLWVSGEVVDFVYNGTYWCIQKEFGTKVTLNGSDKKGTTASFYAPTGAGTSGQILKSNGNGAPSWSNKFNITLLSSQSNLNGTSSTKTVSTLTNYLLLLLVAKSTNGSIYYVLIYNDVWNVSETAAQNVYSNDSVSQWIGVTKKSTTTFTFTSNSMTMNMYLYGIN